MYLVMSGGMRSSGQEENCAEICVSNCGVELLGAAYCSSCSHVWSRKSKTFWTQRSIGCFGFSSSSSAALGAEAFGARGDAFGAAFLLAAAAAEAATTARQPPPGMEPPKSAGIGSEFRPAHAGTLAPRLAARKSPSSSKALLQGRTLAAWPLRRAIFLRA